MESYLRFSIFLQFLVVLLTTVKNGSGYMVGNDPYHRREILDSKGKYQLEWRVNWREKRISFNVTVETRGYVGFGLSSNGKMTGADIVIGGVRNNGESYFSDRHAVGNQLPEIDPSQDWTFHWSKETSSHTLLSFSRAFDTCDPQDYPITENKISVIWSYGERDNEIAYHHRNRGEYQVYLLHPDYSPAIVNDPNVGSGEGLSNTSNLQKWTINTEMVIPAQDTTYWCTMHKGPSLPRKHHMVGFEVRFADETSRRHVHHLVLHRCHAPQGRSDANRMFSSFLQHRGQHCLSVKAPVGPMPTEYCTQHYQVWGVGGRPFFFPPHVGFPLSEERDEYYLLQVHYDNPDKLENIRVNTSIDYYYTRELRRNEGAIMFYRHESPGVTPSILIPPSTPEHTVYGFCGRQCTREILPPEGVRAFGLILHAHNTGSAIKFQHFRGNRELPWIESDNNYGFNYQQVRALNREVRIQQGDLLAVRCSYDSTRVNGSVVGGFSSQQEMCAVFFFYYNRVNNYVQCSSEIESPEARRRFLGIGNVTWSNREVEFIVNEPENLAGLRVSQVSDNLVDWSVERREELQRFHLETPHKNRCPRELYSLPASVGYRQLSSGRSENEEDEGWRTVGYPYQAAPYQPPRSCSFQ